jgi:hypothetical protein
MATVYNYEESLDTTGFTNGFCLTSAANIKKIVFNDTNSTLTNVYTTAAFVNTAGLTLSSGAGQFHFDNAYSGKTVYLMLPDRTSFSVALLSAVGGYQTSVTLVANGYEAWGPTERRLRALEYI